MHLYDFADYRKLIRAALDEKKASLGSLYTSKSLAEACKVQSTYLSKVLSGRAHLSADQLYLASHYLGFNPEETAFIFLLFDEQRTSVPQRRLDIQARIKQIQDSRLKSESRLQASALRAPGSGSSDYYLNPYLPLVHMFLTIERYAQKPSLIAEALRLEPENLAEMLRKLQSMGMIEMHNGVYAVVKNNLHLPKDSPLYRPYRSLWRLKTLERIDQISSDKAYNFSVTFASTARIKQKIQASFLEFLQATQKLVGSSRSEHVYQMNFDLFDWD